MKLLPFIFLFFAFFTCFAQENDFDLKGVINDTNLKPVTDAYIINFRNLDKVYSEKNGSYNIRVKPGDSLMISHISFYRKIIHVDSVKFSPNISLTLDTVNIFSVDVSPNQKNDYERARQNISFLKDLEISEFTKIKTETDPAYQMVIEHNRVFRAEASSVSFARFSPSEQIGKLISKIRKRKKSKQY
ncbi:MAG: hypothetical protein HN778_06070 [Prolixibacteraceae bacterium]|jgi:hypothetical protein|nr:hypothetical protein [Prolixibacteraceae bacterium]MBT6998455.1 hypothetical protein [Prolixibacteraceae bacterium]MBT7394381.1 hypothetical protein [Prolixibacteraceae bacterium]